MLHAQTPGFLIHVHGLNIMLPIDARSINGSRKQFNAGNERDKLFFQYKSRSFYGVNKHDTGSFFPLDPD